jgi:hypothetical protein
VQFSIADKDQSICLLQKYATQKDGLKKFKNIKFFSKQAKNACYTARLR